ncbi:AAA family ATPase [Streptomyces sp. NPDC050264]|uniref:ATP-binding protein n=1 Tax=Streptomyces sp. NPDC050264 TaxID=3155038 RepID=UPI003442E35C
MNGGILERDLELERLAAAVRDATDGAGSVVLVLGEAGIGKSSLVRALPRVLPRGARLLVGHCDDLATGRPLGPLRDLVGSVGAELARALRDAGDRHRVHEALHAELAGGPHPAVLVVEDVHWADEASLDALRYLVRRVEGLPAVLVLTYRDDELGRGHPLRQLLGLVSGAARVHRLPLAPLSPEAVRALSAAADLDPAQVYTVTSGNPFFVAEVVAAGTAFGDSGAVPPTVVDAVLARLRGLSDTTRDALEQLAVVPSAVERSLVDALLGDGERDGALAAAEQGGLLVVAVDRVAFRHEIIRRVVVDSLPAARRIALDRAVLSALVKDPDADRSRIVHHAAAAGDAEAVTRFGPGAARDAARAGAHREAAAHLRLVLRHRHRFGPAERADLLEQFAVESYTIGDAGAAVGAQRDAVGLRRELADLRALGADLRWLSRIHWWAGDADAAQAAAREALAVLEQAGDERLLALALSNTAQLRMLSGEDAAAADYGERAMALARSAGDAAILAHALNNVGSARWRSGDPAGQRQLEESLRVALAAGEVEHACRAYANIVWFLLDDLRLTEADRLLTPAMELADRAEHLGFLTYLRIERALHRFASGDWAAAERCALLGADVFPPARCPALTVLARVRIRRGTAGGDELLDRAWRIALGTRELQRTGPVAAARAEAAWLRGDPAGVVAAAEPVHTQARRLSAPPHRAELGYWLAKAGRTVPPYESCHPYALQAAGQWDKAARVWQEAGCPYEYAAALAESPDPADKMSALRTLDALGARPLARLVRAELHALGVRHVPRGPHAATRRNPAGLTGRQLQVVRLLVEGLTNPEIADRLVLSVRTVDNHVRAVLEKLDAPTRRRAAARARALGLLPEGET